MLNLDYPFLQISMPSLDDNGVLAMAKSWGLLAFCDYHVCNKELWNVGSGFFFLLLALILYLFFDNKSFGIQSKNKQKHKNTPIQLEKNYCFSG